MLGREGALENQSETIPACPLWVNHNMKAHVVTECVKAVYEVWVYEMHLLTACVDFKHCKSGVRSNENK